MGEVLLNESRLAVRVEHLNQPIRPVTHCLDVDRDKVLLRGRRDGEGVVLISSQVWHCQVEIHARSVKE